MLFYSQLLVLLLINRDKLNYGQGPGTSEGALINVLVGGSKSDIAAIRDAYTKSKYFYCNESLDH